MRIDYFLVSEKLRDQIVSCKMHGHGIELEGISCSVLQVKINMNNQLSYLFSK